jgi:hypothetical protein
MPDAALVEAIRQALASSPFHGEGYRKVWARLRHAGLRTSKERVRRLMRENGLQAASRPGRPRGPRTHDGTIIPETIDTMWGADMTSADHHVADDDLHLGRGARRRRLRHSALDHQFREHRQRRHALGHDQLPRPQLPAPVVNLPARRPVPPRDIRNRGPGHQALRRNPRPLRLGAPLSPSITSSRENPTLVEPSRWTPSLPSLSNIQHLRTANRRMAGSDY